ncbi:NADH dehydrogenase [ubiquinone] 1 alpha subcomplex subunit 10, mitochondrial-like [Mercenaria mercenaria]|uniref:NADH dehydrogenase [ubiquinone] 1 alpha subcomplex subunit 10, mitochondrial-like n=1 Tax=Mercenaria mercenaria TaxID=6596 RepID=UPI001E1DC95E|nr:NADH dehydrogenase [ubiquinone] 1 alpha subcomplex subunit 10, mitochondrial-like [Mercenaria mercenaria]
MSVSQARLCLFVGRGSALFARQPNFVVSTTVEGHRHLTTHPQYKKPYPYERRRFGFFNALLDYTVARINENSRILMIEGPPCVGKTEFAKKVADAFQLKYMPAITEEDLFIRNGFDRRELNNMMPTEKMRCYDLDMFYAEPDPKNMMYFGATQVDFFKARYYQYVDALKHLLHTGQGVVLENSVWSDACYALNMADHGYFSKQGIRWFMDYRKNVLNFLWKPHLVIHLDAPSSLTVKNMKEKHPQYEHSPVLRESYFDGLREKFQKFYIPYMEKHCDTLYYDVTNMEDFDLLAMDLEGMDLISARFGESFKFANWRKDKEEQWSMYRVNVSDPTTVENNLNWRGPWNVPELSMSGEELAQLQEIEEKIPQLRYADQYWYDKAGNFTPRPELGEHGPLSLARDVPECNQGVGAKQISA